MSDEIDKLTETSAAIKTAFDEFEEFFEKHSEETWNSLDKEKQLDVFCAVMRRLYKGEIEDKGSYRYVLYNVFEFGPEAYVPAQISGFLSIHNSIMDEGYDSRLLKAFCNQSNIENAEEKINKFICY